MSAPERLVAWNRWYDELPEDWRFQFVVWSLLVIGAINMLLTVAIGFPFALLVVLGIVVIAAIRLPYALGWVAPPSTGAIAHPQPQIHGPGWLINLNQRYEAIPERRRFWIYPAILLIAGGINMMLTIGYDFPFGLLFLLALLVIVLVRAPYTAGWLRYQAPAPAQGVSEPFDVPPEHDVAPRHDAMRPHDLEPPHDVMPPHDEVPPPHDAAPTLRDQPDHPPSYGSDPTHEE